ncbi:MAG: hypothetical protein JW995_00755 [Melioribacteraceae bacterium]|nr:hypothetical protein [Melioribacteraceae bacterium]
MKKLCLLILLAAFAGSHAQDSLEIAILERRVGNLAEITQELLQKVDSLAIKINDLENKLERSIWVQIDEGMKYEEVIKLLGVPDEYIQADFGYQKMIYGKGYSGYVLIDKDKLVVDSSPPLYLRMDSNLIHR